MDSYLYSALGNFKNASSALVPGQLTLPGYASFGLRSIRSHANGWK